jgi:hypothetical protein
MFRKFENSSTKPIVEQPMSLQTLLGSVMEFAKTKKKGILAFHDKHTHVPESQSS